MGDVVREEGRRGGEGWKGRGMVEGRGGVETRGGVEGRRRGRRREGDGEKRGCRWGCGR